MTEVIGLPNNSYKPITNKAWVRARLYKLQKGCTRLTTASVKAYHGRWFSPGTPASFTTKTSCHEIAEILLKVALNTSKKSMNQHHNMYSCITIYDKEEIERPWNNRAYEILCSTIISGLHVFLENMKMTWIMFTLYWLGIASTVQNKILALPSTFIKDWQPSTSLIVFAFREIISLQKRIIFTFQENIISRRLTTKTSVNGIFYVVLERVAHQVDVCSGQLIVTCVVGKTEIPVHQKSFNGCTSNYHIYSK